MANNESKAVSLRAAINDRQSRLDTVRNATWGRYPNRSEAAELMLLTAQVRGLKQQIRDLESELTALAVADGK